MATHHRWALAAAAVAGVTILSVQQTGALWSDSADSVGATIRSGSLGIAVGQAGSTVEPYQFADLTAPNMMSGDFVQQPLRVHNTGSEAMQYRLESALLGVDLPLQLRVTPVPSEDDCSDSEGTEGTPMYTGPMDGSLTEEVSRYRALSADASEVLCFRVTMGEDAVVGEPGTATFIFQATQS